MILKKLKSFFKSPRDIIAFFLPILIALILIIPVPYYVTVGGGVLNIDNKINIDNEYTSKGSIKGAYVKELKGTVISYLLAKIIPSYELEKITDVTYDDESYEDYEFRERLSFENSIDDAVVVAYQNASRKIDLSNQDIYVIMVDKDAITDLEVGDRIIKVDGKEVNKVDQVLEMVANKDFDDEINIEVENNDKIKMKKAKLNPNYEDKKVGIYLDSSYNYKVQDKIDFKFGKNEAGPSGGLMLSLSIYNKLVKEDITNGKKIVGTGTIDINGNVGEIGGVTYKLQGAVKDKADLFLVPIGNYDEAMQYKKEHNLKINIKKVATFSEALKVLKELK